MSEQCFVGLYETSSNVQSTFDASNWEWDDVKQDRQCLWSGEPEEKHEQKPCTLLLLSRSSGSLAFSSSLHDQTKLYTKCIWNISRGHLHHFAERPAHIYQVKVVVH